MIPQATTTLTAASPYAPPRRNSYLRQSSSSIRSTTSNSTSSHHPAAAFAFLLFVIRFWKEVINRKSIQDFFQRPTVQKLLTYIKLPIKYILPLLPSSSSQLNRRSLVPGDLEDDNHKSTETNEGRDDFAPVQSFSLRPSILSDTNSVGSSSLDNHNDQRSTASSYRSSTTYLRYCTNLQKIQTVLNYWFGQYTPDNSQKNLWMIANSSSTLRTRVDKEIVDKFESLLLDLSNAGEESKTWIEWCVDRDSVYGHQGKIATIIVLDQFSRHIQRYYEENNDGSKHNDQQQHQPNGGDIDRTTTTKLPSKKQLDSLAYKTSQLLVEKHKSEIDCGMIPLPMYIFALMPYRHASTIDSVQYVQTQVENCSNMNEQMDAMLSRFRKASNRRMAVLQDEARRTGHNGKGEEKESKSPPSAGSAIVFKDEEILETFPFEADLKPALNHPVHKTIVRFLEQNGITPTTPPTNHPRNGSETSDDTTYTLANATPVIVSLSGGVDSMVIAAGLAHLKQSCGYNLLIIAVHIDYGNRPESGAEADFVRRYCEQHSIQPYIRRIDEVTRGITARDDYEKISREIRYDSYRRAIENALKQIDQATTKTTRIESSIDPSMVGVMLGHHRGDLRENVLSNAHKGCSPLDLSGMTSVSKNDGVMVYRPLLPLEKTFVLDYAHKFGVPYFKDTTPHWSTRGKLRNKLLPLLQEIYGEGSMDNLSDLAIESDECRKLLFKSMIGPFLDQIERKPMGIAFDTTPWKEQHLFFWKIVLRQALHSAKFGMFSDKSVVSFLERVQAKKVKSAWLQCRKDYAVYLRDDGKVFVFYPSSFPWHKKDEYVRPEQAVPFNVNIRVGPWAIKAEVVSDKSDCPDKFRLGQRAIPSMDHLMDGVIEYYLEAPTSYVSGKFMPSPLVFCQFRKADRPPAWKNTDLKLQSTLPLLGIDEAASIAVKENSGNEENPMRLIRVTLRLDDFPAS